MIRLVLLIPTLVRSGAEKQLTLLATGLPRYEFDVHVIALTSDGPYAEVLREHDIPLTILNKRSKLDIGALRRLRDTLTALQPDVLNTWLFAANAYGRLAVGRSPAMKVVVSERCVDSWKAGWQLWLDRRLISRTDLLIGNSRSVTDFYIDQGFPAEKTTVISNGLDLPTPHEDVKGRTTRINDLDLPPDARLIGYVGRLAPQKRVDDLLWAMQVVRQADDRAYLLIIGDGPERGRLEQYAVDVECHRHVRFLGHRDDAASLMQSLNVFWLGSSFEGLSNSLMEAMAAKVPVVATNIPPNRELITHGEQGFLVDVGDGVGFAQFTIRLLQDAQLARTMGEAGRSRIAADFSVQKMVDAHAAAYREVCGSAVEPSRFVSRETKVN